MRFFTSASCITVAAVLLASCSNSGGGSSSSALPNPGSQSQGAARHAGNWVPFNSAGWKLDGKIRGEVSQPPQGLQRGGYYGTEFRGGGVGVFGFSPKPNKSNAGPVCSPPGNRFNVNGVASDEKGNLIVPGSSKPGGDETTGWNVSVYQGSTQPLICGQLLGSIPTNDGQPVDAASFNAMFAPIAVSEINFTTKKGEIVLCTLASLSCGAPVTSAFITGPSAGVAMDAAGDCWLSTAKRVSDTGPSGFRLIYWAGCTGSGQVATGTRGQASYGGLFIDNAGNIGSFDAFNSKLIVYSGCNPSCTEVGKFELLGQSFFGNLNGSGAKLAVGNTSTGAVDVYNYQLPTFTHRYSFDSGLRRSRLVESGIFSPTNQRTH